MKGVRYHLRTVLVGLAIGFAASYLRIDSFSVAWWAFIIVCNAIYFVLRSDE